MRIYEGSPRENWEEVLRLIGAYVDRELLKEILLLELEDKVLLQVLELPPGGTWAETVQLHKRTMYLDDEALGQLMEEAEQRRGTVAADRPQVEATNYYEQALRVIGRYIDEVRPRDVFLFEQEGSFVLRTLATNPAGISSHQLAEFTRDEILTMISEGPSERGKAPDAPGA